MLKKFIISFIHILLLITGIFAMLTTITKNYSIRYSIEGCFQWMILSNMTALLFALIDIIILIIFLAKSTIVFRNERKKFKTKKILYWFIMFVFAVTAYWLIVFYYLGTL